MNYTLGAMLIAACRRYGDRVALVGRDGERTYRELLERGTRLANAFAGLGLRPGEHVAALLEDTVTAFEVYVGCALGGYPIVHVNDRLVAREVDYILDDSDAVALVHTDGRTGVVAELATAPALRAVITIGTDRPTGARDYEDLLAAASAIYADPGVEPEDLAILGYTSGTTGFPKGAMASNRAVTACMRLIPFAYRLPMYGRCAFTGTLSFVSGIWGIILPHLYVGGTVSFLSPYTVESWVDHMIENRSTFTYAPSPLVPGFIAEARRRPEVLTSLESVLHSASSLPPEHARGLVDLIGERYVEVWGMTETVAPLTATTRADWRGEANADDIFASVGRPLANASVRVVDAERNTITDGSIGELAVEADTMFSGYWGNPDKTAEVLVDGEYFTGDLGRIDEHGYVYVTDRAKDLIISGGMNVYPAEVEAVLATMPGVAQATVVGTPHEKWGEAVVAVIVPEPGLELSAEDVIEFARRDLASYKKPTVVRFVDDLPRNASLKVQKHLVRQMIAEESSPR